jgi:2-deoxy-D-gluconate 3-dehydrogenase
MILDQFRLDGKVALVSGANTGLGQAMAIALAQAGANVVAIGRSEPTQTELAIRQAGRDCLWLPAEFTADADPTALIQQAVEHFGSADILVNNAGTIRRNAAVDFTPTEWDEVMDVNLKSVFFLSQAFARQLLQRKRPGKIINIVSMLSFQGGIRVASYTASKSGLLGLTRLLANEWAVSGINVNAIAPGYFATSNTTALRADEGRNRDILARIPAGEWGDPAALAGAVVYLASAASNYVHGSVLAVDGGWLGR